MSDSSLPRNMISTLHRFPSAAVLAVLMMGTGFIASGCSDVLEPIRDAYRPISLHDAYRHALDQSGLLDAAIGQRWLLEAEGAIVTPLDVELPHREVLFVDAARPEAFSVSVNMIRGQRLIADVSAREPASMQVFMDIFEDRTSDGLSLHRVTSADSTQTVSWDILRSGRYVIRVQPELLVDGTFTLTLSRTASILFPVSGRTFHDVGSRFGDPRDGGRREHHGLDIFARRGTPVVASVNGLVRSTRVGGLGGKTVWLRDTETGANYYYAHLDEQLVQEGQRVAAGDTLGTVGNTGNARTTPPHLHFGIYANGPNDPWPFVFRPRMRPESPTVALDALGSWQGASSSSGERSALRIVGAAGNAYRVRRSDGTSAFVPARTLAALSTPLDALTPSRPTAVKAKPSPAAPTMALLPAGESQDIVAREGAFDAVTLPDGRIGWIARPRQAG